MAYNYFEKTKKNHKKNVRIKYCCTFGDIKF